MNALGKGIPKYVSIFECAFKLDMHLAVHREDVRGHNPQTVHNYFMHTFFQIQCWHARLHSAVKNPIGPSREGLSRRIWMGRRAPLTLQFSVYRPSPALPDPQNSRNLAYLALRFLGAYRRQATTAWYSKLRFTA